MKKLLFVLCFAMGLALPAFAQYPKVVVQFTNKQFNSFSTANPSAFLSAKGIQRRTKQSIAIDSTDLPVTQRYLDSVRLAGNVTILSVSKWLNQVLIQTNDAAAITKIRSFPFVQSTRGIGFRTAAITPKEKFTETVTNLPPSPPIAARNQADVFNYGNNYNQVHIHEGEFLHNKGFSGQGMMIAVLDAGFLQFKNHSALDSVRINGQILGERDFVAFDNSVNEDNQHGMQCLSTIAANKPGQMVGTAPKANFWLLRTENAFSEYPIEEYNWVVGAEFADSCGADMLSSSLGYYDFDDPQFNYSYADFYKNKTTVTRGASLAAKKGMIVMNSAGNEGNGAWRYLVFPADADSVCAVGAVNNGGAIASFSSYGYMGKVKPNVVSVGQGTIISNPGNNIGSGNGTSFSNPNMAGLVACLWQAFPTVSNMNILDALYKSADRYAAPTDRYGFGIPNMKTAYRSLKKEQNMALYGADWMWATPTPFTTKIDVRFIGQVDGTATLQLTDAVGTVIATQVFASEKEEVYNHSFINLGNLLSGIYYVKYTDNTKTRSIELQKGNLFEKDWLRVLPVPFNTQLKVFIKAPESGVVNMRLTDAKGSVVETLQTTLTNGQTTTLSFTKAAALQRGAYYVQYISSTQKRTLKVVKQ
jgi:hypothetical protein